MPKFSRSSSRSTSKLMLRGAAWLICAAIAACSSAANDADAREPVPNGWQEVRPEPGVAFRMPSGWQATRQEEGKGPIVFTGPGSARVLVLPVFLPANTAQPPPALVVQHFVQQYRPQLRWSRPQPVGNAATRAMGQDATTVALATFAYRNSPAGVAGYFYLTEASPAEYRGMQATFAGILAGLQFSGSGNAPANGARRSALRYVAWQDPTEGAFTTQVPANWQVSGGVVRASPLQLAMPMRLAAPDQSIALFVGDPQIAGPAAFIVPTQMMMSTGFGEGTRYNSSIVRRYQTPTQLLPSYVAQAFRSTCSQTRVVFSDDFAALRPQLDAAAQQQSLQGMGARLDIGLIAFECATPKGVMTGVTFARTRASIMYGAAMGLAEDMITWDVDLLFGFISHPDRVLDAMDALGKVVTSWRVNPQWVGGNTEVAAAISQITTDTTAYTNRILNETYMQRSLSGSENSRIQSNRILDAVDVIDPNTREQYKIESTSNYYWINGQGTIVGTNVPARPDIDYTEMVQLP